MDDVRVRTSTGAIITFISLFVILILTFGELRDYASVHTKSHLVVDSGRETSIPILLDVSFPRVPCYLVSVDVVDVAGKLQVDIKHDIVRTRLDKHGQVIEQGRKGLRGEAHDVAATRAPDYCGNCYGGTPSEDTGCCNTCDEVRESYARKGWSFPNPDGVEQCRAEHWTEKVQHQAEEGCAVSGVLHVNKVIGNIHISMGRTFQVNQWGMQNLVPYLQGGKMPATHDFGHTINELSFGAHESEFTNMGPSGRAQIADHTKSKLKIRDPLKNHVAHMDKGNFMYQYYMKVVPTEYNTIDGQRLATRQYSVTAYERDLNPGADATHAAQVGAGLAKGDANDAHMTLHGYRGTPSVLFNYELAPLKTVRTETSRSLAHFLGAVCAIVGGILTLGTVVDSYIYRTRLRSAARTAPRGALSVDDGLGFASASGKFL